MISGISDMDRFKNELAESIDSLYAGENRVLVFGEGQRGARVMLIGEAPGEQESLLGRPFVGKAGKNLDAFLQSVGIARDDLYVTNTVKFRPVKLSGTGHIVNRPPSQEEIGLFKPWLLREIELVDPGCIVTLGNVPLKALAGRDCVIGAVHGQFLEAGGRRLFPMYHPASVIYNPSLQPIYQRDIEIFAHWLEKNADCEK